MARADVDLADNDGNTPLTLGEGRGEIARILSEAGVGRACPLEAGEDA